MKKILRYKFASGHETVSDSAGTVITVNKQKPLEGPQEDLVHETYDKIGVKAVKDYDTQRAREKREKEEKEKLEKDKQK